jgi:hypothetical protein
LALSAEAGARRCDQPSIHLCSNLKHCIKTEAKDIKMKKFTKFTTLLTAGSALLLTGLLAGCAEEKSNDLEDARDSMQDAARSTGDYLEQKGDAIADGFRRNRDAFTDQMSELRREAADTGADSREGFQQAMGKLETEWDQFTDMLGDATEASGDALKESWERVRDAYEAARAELR